MNESFPTEHRFRVLTNNVQMLGVRQTVRDLLAAWLNTPPKDDFDAKYGVETRLCVSAQDAGIPQGVLLTNAVRYAPIPERVMRHFLDRVAQRIDVQRCKFIDLGCGKGRAVMLASELPFREVIGVELSPSLCESARANWLRYRASRPRASRANSARVQHVTIHCSNGAEYAFPDGDLLIYMFRPFMGSVFRQAMERICAAKDASPRRILLALCHPREEFVLENHPRFEKQLEHQVVAESFSWNLWECRPAH